MRDEEKRALDEQGYVKLPGFIDPGLLERLRSRIDELYAEEGDRAGSEFKQEPGSRRLANLVDKDPVFAGCVAREDLLRYVRHVLGPRLKLSSLNARSANPHNGIAQPLHADMGAIADERGYWVCNTVWMLDDFTPANGAVRVVPGSHRWRKLPQQELEDPLKTHPDELLVTGRAGDLVVMNAHAWHGGTANGTSMHRRAMHGFYCRWDKPQQQYQRGLLSDGTQARLTPEQREILALDDTANDELSTRDVVRSGFLK